MMYEAIELAKYIVTKCVKDKEPISNLQLQKILFFIQKSFLQDYDRTAFDDVIEAWQFGPVVPEVYYRFCGYGAMPISMEYEHDEINIDDEYIIDKIVEEKRVLKPWALVEATHKKGGAWDQIYRDGIGNHKEIPIKLIKKVG